MSMDDQYILCSLNSSSYTTRLWNPPKYCILGKLGPAEHSYSGQQEKYYDSGGNKIFLRMDTCSMFINKDSLLLHYIHPKFIIQRINIKLLTMTHRPLLPSSWLPTLKSGTRPNTRIQWNSENSRIRREEIPNNITSCEADWATDI